MQHNNPTGTATPVVILIYNRASYTERLVQTLREQRPKKLYVVADGPRTPADQQKTAATRAAVQVDWPCEVTTIYSEINLGLRKRIQTGLSEVFKKEESAIILEDDCIPDPTFFPYCEELLARYNNSEQVMLITGSNPLGQFPLKTSYDFSRYVHIWGWATWARQWQKYDDTMEEWPGYKKSGWLKKFYTHRGVRAYLTNMFDQAYYKHLNSWATRWFYTCLKYNGLCIFPATNLITNIGIEGEHTSGKSNNIPTTPLSFPLSHPSRVIENKQYDQTLFDTNFPWRLLPTPRTLMLKFLVQVKRLLKRTPLVRTFIP